MSTWGLKISANSSHWKAIAALALAVIAMSNSGLMVRYFSQVDAHQISAFRALGAALCGFVYMVAGFGGRRWAGGGIGHPGIYILAAAYTINTTLYMVALRETTVAHAAAISAASPVFAAALAWSILRERINTGIWMSLVIVVIGVAIMIGTSAIGHDGTLFGDALALAVSLLFAAQIVLLRYYRGVDVVPGLFLGGLLSLGTNLLLTGQPIAAFSDALGIVLIGIFLHGLPWLVLIFMSRCVSAIQVTTITLLDVVFNPLLVWLVTTETPSLESAVGAFMICLGVVVSVRSQWPR